MNIIDVVIPLYNDSTYLAETVTSVCSQCLPKGWSLRVYIVDDGSNVAISLEEMGIDFSNVLLLRHAVNKGRAAACNTGADKGKGCCIYVLDADCVLREKNILSSHIRVLNKGDVSISCGSIFKSGESFWARYQNEVANRREAAFESGELASLTTANCLIFREAYQSVNGFDEAFSQYGFEDRDLLLRLIKAKAAIGFCHTAPVEHMCDLTLLAVARKLYKGGAFSSALFIDRHKIAYEKMHFAKADVKYSKGSLRVLVLLTRKIVWPLVNLLDWVLKKRILPFFLAKKLVKYILGLAYLHGTADRA